MDENLYKKALELATSFGNGDPIHHTLYNMTVEQYNELAVHYEWGTSPSKLIKEYRPSETNFSYEYRIKSYQQITYSVAQKILQLQRGVLSDEKLYSISFPSNPPDILSGKDSIENYCKHGAPIPKGSIESYFWEFLFQMILIDPNGYVAIMTKKSDEEARANASEYRKPYPVFIPSDHVLDYSEDYLFAKSSDTRTVSDGKNEHTAQTYYFFTLNGVYHCIPVRVTKDGGIIYEVIPWFTIENNELRPFRQAGGIIAGNNRRILSTISQAIHLSHLQPTIPTLNKALTLASDTDALLVSNLHPIRYGMPMLCSNCGGDQYVLIKDTREKCGVCNGVGTVIPTSSPLEGYMVPPDAKGEIHAPVNFVNPPVEPFREAKEYFYQLLDDSLKALDMDLLITKNSGVGQTARAKEIDREPLHAFFKKVSNTVFPIMQWIYDQINLFRYSSFINEEQFLMNKVQVMAPIHFDTTRVFELLEDIEKAISLSFPVATRRMLAGHYFAKIFGSGTKDYKMNMLYLQIDELALLSDDEKANLLLIDPEASKETTYIHNHLESLIEKAIESNPEFIVLDISTQKEIIKTFIPNLEVQGNPVATGTNSQIGLGSDVLNS